MRLDSAKNIFTRLLPLSLVLAQPGEVVNQPSEATQNTCELPQSAGNARANIQGFRSDALSVLAQTSTNPPNVFGEIQPTFDDGPHENDLALVRALNQAPFKPAVFYYVGGNFYNPDGNIDPEKVAIAKTILDSGHEIGFHGMTHVEENDPNHLKNLDAETFRSQIEAFENLIRTTTHYTDYEVRHIRPPYGAWDENEALNNVIAEQEAELRNWSFASFDWESSERTGSALLSEALRASYVGKSPDILFHSQHQDGSTNGSFGLMLDAYTSQVDSLLLPEREEEILSYRELLESLLLGKEMKKKTRLLPSPFEIGSSEQILIDASYNVGFETIFQGSLQSQLLNHADGYIGSETEKEVRSKWSEETKGSSPLQLIKMLRDPNRMLAQEAFGIPKTLPTIEALNDKSVRFANRGLQVKKIAEDLICRDTSLREFLQNYRLGNLFIDEALIPVYEQMDVFMTQQGLDSQTTARILATAILESGVKNNWDKIGIGKGTWEAGARMAYESGLVPDSLIGGLRSLGQKKVADTLSFGPHSIGPGQVPMAITHSMFEAILGKPLSNEEMIVILDSPEGSAFAIYLIMRQNELRLQSTEI